MIDTLPSKCPRIRLCSSEPEYLHDVQSLLEIANYETDVAPLAVSALDDRSLDQLDLLVVEGSRHADENVLDFCRQFRNRLAERFVPLVFVTDDPSQLQRVFTSTIGTDGYFVRPIDPVVLLSQVQALLRIKFLQDRVVDQSREIERAHQSLKRAYQQIDQELQLARRIQQSMLPRDLPANDRVRFSAKFAVSGQVSGDFYDVVTVADSTTAFYLADAMGHGVPAGLLTIFVKKGIQPIELVDGSARLLEPGRVLEKLNHDLVQQDLSENPFITMAYFTFDHATRVLSFTRAGHPYPVLLSPGQPIRELKAEGTLMGVFDTDYPTERVQLAPGDKVLVYTDGIDGVRFGGHKEGFESFRACLESHHHRPVSDLVERVYDDLFPQSQHDDDFTLLGLEIMG